jgi:hypothetical protein
MKKISICLFLLNVAFASFAAVGDIPLSAAPDTVVNNKYFTESIRYSNLAKLSFADGDFDRSLNYSAESVRQARLSDEYITQRLLIAAANEKISEAEEKLNWADRSRAHTWFPKELSAAKDFFNEAIVARAANEWDSALNNAINAVETLAVVVSPPEEKPAAGSKTGIVNVPLPARYTVRSWDAFGDCFWNIAGRAWVYNNPHKWPILYHANKQKLPDPNNPNRIEPGIVLDIPSINGEQREGMWDSGAKYSPLGK